MVEFLTPTMEVLRDQRVTTAEVNWYIQELMMIAIMATVTTTCWGIVEEAV